MFKKFIRKVLGRDAIGAVPAVQVKPKKSANSKPAITRQEVGLKTHGINRKLIDPRALEVVQTLHDAGYEAYIVGGAVRDLLLGLRPKDFDVATNATPEEVKAEFRRAFIIGRRFRIVHVVFGRGRQDRGLSEVIEVSTFRANISNTDAPKVKGNEHSQKRQLEGMAHAVDTAGRVLRDNVWGSMEDDSERRDFTINALYYDPVRQIVVDNHGGILDAKKQVLRLIGDAASRYREDPVRIIRAVRFAAKLAKLGFKLEKNTQAAIAKSKNLLADVPPSRLFDEMLKLLQTGHALASVQVLRDLKLESSIDPLLELIVARADGAMVQGVLEDTDRRVAEGKSVVPSYLLACVLWQDVLQGWDDRRLGRNGYARLPAFPALQEAIDAVFNERIGDVSGRGRLAADMREIWLMQPRFERRTASAAFSLIEQSRFRAGFDFLRLRGESDEAQAGNLAALAQWWQAFQIADDEARVDLIAQVKLEPKKSNATSALEEEGSASAPAKKKRRRKRKPASAKPQAQDPSSEFKPLDPSTNPNA